MFTVKRFNSIEELQRLQVLANRTSEPVGLYNEDSTIIVDAKSFVGLFALDFTKPVLVVSEDMNFHRRIMNVGETLDFKPEFLKCDVFR